VAVIIRAVVSERSEGESVFIEIFGVSEQRFDEVGASNVVNQVAEEMAAVRVITEILNDCSAVGIAVGLPKLIMRCPGKALKQEWTDSGLPGRVNDRFVSQHRVRPGTGRTDSGHDQKSANARQEFPDH
jgi:hypothetical protein